MTCQGIPNGNPSCGGGTTPGTILQDQDPAPNNILANRVVNPPTIEGTTEGNTNLQSEDVASHGITGATTEYATIGGGKNNLMTTNCDFSTIAGGQNNDINDSIDCAIAGGDTNIITDGDNSCIGGGSSNLVEPQSGQVDHSTIAGGFLNVIRESHGTIAGGERNEIGRVGGSGGAVHATIGGGLSNDILRGDNATIGGGETNVIGATAVADWSTIPGGEANVCDGANYATAAGRRSKVRHLGAYLHSDASNQDEESDRANQHKVVAVGGVTERTTTGFGGIAGDPGEAIERFTGHATTVGIATDITAIGTLDTDQHVLTFEITMSSIQSAGASSKAQRFLVQATRTGGVVTVLSASLGAVSVGAAATDVTYTFTVVGNDIRVETAVAVGGNYQHGWHLTRQEVGLTA